MATRTGPLRLRAWSRGSLVALSAACGLVALVASLRAVLEALAVEPASILE
jgi:hypothetical protein